MRSPLASVGQSRETWPTSPPIHELIADTNLSNSGILTVVALLSLGAVTGHVAETTARVAGLLAATGATGASETAVVTTVTTTVVTTLRAVTRNVADLSALVALLVTTTAVVAVAALGAFAGKVTSLSATVARLLLGRLLAFTAFTRC
jgi:hypothetical protein